MEKHAKSKMANIQGALSQKILPNEEMGAPPRDAEDENKSEGAEDLKAPEPKSPSNMDESDLKSINSDRARALSELRKTVIPDYIEANAIELKRIKTNCFKNEFFDTMQQCNYSRYIEQEKFVKARFVGDPDDGDDEFKPK